MNIWNQHQNERCKIDTTLFGFSQGSFEICKAKSMGRCVHHACRPKCIWHIDGLCINGCICGFSRKIIWLNVYQTNIDPKIIGGYFLDVKANGGCPLKIRTDYRTENGHDSSKAVLLLWIFVLQVFAMLSCASVY